HLALHSFPTRRSSDLARRSARGRVQSDEPDERRHTDRELRIGFVSNESGSDIWSSDGRRRSAIGAARSAREVLSSVQNTSLTPRSEEHTSELQSPYDL